jgi:cell division septal protein FtsQ
MKSTSNYKNKGYLKLILSFLIFGILISFFLLFFKINKFQFGGDLNFVDIQILKINSLNYLKDQPIFWFNKEKFENSLLSDMPQVKSLNYHIINSDTLKIEIVAEDICCVIQDPLERRYVISSNGLILRQIENNVNSNLKFYSVEFLEINQNLNTKLVEVLKKINQQEFNIEDIKENSLTLDKEEIFFYTSDSKKIIINENTDLKKINENIKSMKSHLQQNQKNYSILDLRFEKIIVK